MTETAGQYKHCIRDMTANITSVKEEQATIKHSQKPPTPNRTFEQENASTVSNYPQSSKLVSQSVCYSTNSRDNSFDNCGIKSQDAHNSYILHEPKGNRTTLSTIIYLIWLIYREC